MNPNTGIQNAGYVPRSYASMWLSQMIALLRKCLSMIVFKFSSTVGILVLPALFITAIWGLYTNLSVNTAPPETLSVSRCTAFDVYGSPYDPTDSPCVTFIYAPAGDPTTDSVVQRIANAAGLTIGTDILGYPSVPAAAGAFYDLASRQIDTGIMFNFSGPLGEVYYTLWYNHSLVQTYALNGLDEIWRNVGVSGRYAALQKAVDAAIIEEVVAQGNARVQTYASYRPFDTWNTAGNSSFTASSASRNVLDGYSSLDVAIGAFTDYEEANSLSGSGPSTIMLLLAGATFIVCGTIMGSLLIMSMVVGEKNRRLLGQLRSIGLLESTYWLSWFLAYTPVFIGTALIATGVGKATEVLLFSNTDFSVHFVAILLLCFATTANALCCGACVSRRAYVNVCSFLMFAAAVAICTTFAALQLYAIVYVPSVPVILPVFLGLFPAFHFGRLINTILMFILSGDGPDSGGVRAAHQTLSNEYHQEMLHRFGISLSSVESLFSTVLGQNVSFTAPNGFVSSPKLRAAGGGGSFAQFTWDKLTESPDPVTVYVDGLPQQWTDHPPVFNLYLLIAVSFGYLFLAWYLGQMGGSNGVDGGAQPFYFIFSPYYWGLMHPPATAEPGDTITAIQAASAQEGSVRIHKLSKSYGKKGGGTQALKEVSLTMPPGQLIALLGQNGAGKTSLVNVISGLATPTHGEAFLFGKSVRNEITALREMMGSCPQDDLLWEELSAREHVELYSRFRGISMNDLKDHVDSRLSTVGLLEVGEARVTTFSGGMKRRLSVALSSVGNPRIIFLDEPTTGLDPVSRRRVWNMIESLKRDRVLVLTTHSMEEADALGDQVAILALGRLRAIGTPLFLKSRFGAGYQINLLTDPSRIDELKHLVRTHLPAAEIIGEITADSNANPNNGNDIVPLATMYPNVPGSNVVAWPSNANPTNKQQAFSPVQLNPMNGTTMMMMTNTVSGTVVAPSPASSTNPNGNFVGSRKNTGMLTISVPRNQTTALPAFLRVLQSFSANRLAEDNPSESTDSIDGTDPRNPKTLIKEWAISNSTLEEVFLRLAAANREVNAPLSFSGNDNASSANPNASMDNQIMQQQQLMMMQQRTNQQMQQQASSSFSTTARNQFPPTGTTVWNTTTSSSTFGTANNNLSPKFGRVCSVCEAALTEPVMLFNSAHVQVICPDLLCGACANRTVDEIKAARATAMKKGMLPNNAPALPSSIKVDSNGEDDSEPRNIATATPNPITDGSAVVRNSSTGTLVKNPLTLLQSGNVGNDNTIAPGHVPDAPILTPSSTATDDRRARVIALSAASPNGNDNAPSFIPVSPAMKKRRRVPIPTKSNTDPDYLPPVSFWDQCSAVCYLRMRLNCNRAGFLNILFSVIGIILMVLLNVSRQPINLTRCPTNFYVDNSTGLCDRNVYVSWLADALSRTDYSPIYDPLSTTTSTSATAAGSTASSFAAPSSSLQDSGPEALLLYQPICTVHDPNNYYCTLSPNQFSILPDVSQISMVNSVGLTQNNMFPLTVINFAMADSTAFRLDQFDFFGNGIGNNTIPSIFSLNPSPSSNVDADVFNAQRMVAESSFRMNGTCQYYGTWAGPGNGYEGWYWPNAVDAAAWLKNNLPSAGITVKAANPYDTTVPIFRYELRTWALYSGSNPIYRPQRANAYTWTNVYTAGPPPFYYSCYNGGVYQDSDSPWYSGSATPYDLPGQATLSLLHNAFLQTVVEEQNLRVRGGQTPGWNVDARTYAKMKHEQDLVRNGSSSASAIPSLSAVSSTPFIRTSYAITPTVKWIAAVGTGQQGGVSFSALIWPLFTMTQLGAVAYGISFEKKEQLWAAMTMAGLRPLPYFLGSYFFAVIMVLIMGAVFYTAGYLAGLAAIANASGAVYVALFLTWGHAQASLGLLLGTIIKTPRAASIICNLLVLVSSIANFLVAQFVSPWPWQLTWVPLLSYARASTIILAYGGGKIVAGYELSNALLITAFHGCIAIILAMYLHAVMPGPESTGIIRSPWFPIEWIIHHSKKFIAYLRNQPLDPGMDHYIHEHEGNDTAGTTTVAMDHPGTSNALRNPLQQVMMMTANDSSLSSDPDIDNESRRVQQAFEDPNQSTAIIIDNMIKEYSARIKKSSRKMVNPRTVKDYVRQFSEATGLSRGVERAVDGLDLRVDYGEVLGLLGPNGAGKTTTIACLTGHSSITHGIARVGGFDATTQLDNIWRVLGVCPQFDVVWSELTVREHLYFYARIKGCASTSSNGTPPSLWSSLFGLGAHLRAIIQQVAERVELDGDPFRQPARALSGGMRRRLSIAVSLLGNPRIIFLDEPTTGLDPETRRHIHRIISAQQAPNRAMVITTHSMEEADALCSRIAIMAKGKLRAVGTQLHLKRRYGDGYHLSLTLSVPPGIASTATGVTYLESLALMVHQFVTTHVHANARFINRVSASITYLLPREGVDVANIFSVLETAKTQHVYPDGNIGPALISEYGISQASLEDVFIRVVEAAEGHGTPNTKNGSNGSGNNHNANSTNQTMVVA